MNLFQLGDFKLASGESSNWKIECDALKDDDWKALAYVMSLQHSGFGKVIGVPRGGLKLAKYLEDYITPNSVACLIVDDVYTTGGSINKVRATLEHKYIYGGVVFARNPIRAGDNWVKPLFTIRM